MVRNNYDLTTIQALILRKNDNGVKINPIKKGEIQWLPKSQVIILKEEQKIKIPYWLALKNDLI